MNKRLLSLLLACCFIFSLLPISAMADEAQTTSGTYGDGVTWALYNGVLTISGEGDMYDYTGEDAPWYDMADEITSVVVDDGVTSIGNSAFADCSAITSIELPDGLTRIGTNAFYHCTGMESISIPYGLTAIGNCAFWGCESLKSIDIPSSVTEIGYAAFTECISLTSIVIPDGVERLNDGTFQGCPSLESVTIPASVTSIAAGVFQNDALKDVHYSGSREQWGLIEIDETNTALKKATIHCNDGYSLPSGTCGENVTWTLDNGVLTISGGEFAGYISDYTGEDAPWYDLADVITSIVVDDGVVSIGDHAFQGLKNVEYATLAYCVYDIGEYAFADCERLSSIDMPGVTDIGSYAFFDCFDLNSASIPDGVTTIRNSTFASCSNLVRIEIPASTTTVEDCAFNVCDSLSDVYYYGTRAQWEEITIGDCNIPLTSAAIHCSDDSDGYSGTCGENVKWTLEYGTLTISGEGAMEDYSSSEPAPWYDKSDEITCINVQSGVTGIGAYAFYFCNSLNEVSLEEGLLSIGDFAFARCGWLQSIDIPDSVKSIGDSAFYGCISLNNISIPEGMTTISVSTFASCSDLVRVDIPRSVTTVESNAFDVCDSLSDVYYSDTKAQWDEISIDEGNEPLTSAAIHCIDGDVEPHGSCGETMKWKIGDGVLTISGTGAMYDYEYGSSAAPWYKSRRTISSIVIESGVTSIGSHAFEDCDMAETANISDTVTSIGDGAFTGCWDLSAINVAADNTAYCSVDGVLYDKDMTELVTYPRARSENEYTIPDGVKSIAPSALEDCNRLYSITLPASLTGVDVYAFWRMYNLTQIIVDENNTEWCSVDGVLFSKAKTILTAYPKSKAGSSYNVPDGTQEIADHAFWGNNNLCTVTLPDGLTTINCNAFTGIRSLETVSIPASVSAIGYAAFDECYKLSTVNYGDTVEQWNALSIGADNEPLKTATIHCTNGDIAPHGSCGDKLTWKFENGTLTVSGTGAMYEFGWVSDIPWTKFADGIKAVVIENGVTSICNYAFEDCEALESVSLPASLTIIGEWAFVHCSKLESITLPDGVQTIGSGAFQNCLSLKSVVFPDSVDNIGNSSFANCAALESITLPKTYAIIEEAAFACCPKLSSVFIPGAVYFSGNIFEGCTSLAEINIEDTNPDYCSVDGVAFDKGMTTLVIYPAGRAAEEYTIPDGVTSLPMNAFADCVYLSSVTVPDSVESIEIGAFSECAKLSAINVDENNECYCSVGGVLFNKDKTMLISYPVGKTASHYDVPDGVMILSPNAFLNNRSLQSVTIPASVTDIAYGALQFQYSDCVFSDIYYGGTAEEWKAIVGDDLIYYCLDGVTVHCTDEDILPNGTCGENVTWTLDGSTLTISGEGNMYNFEYMTTQWNGFKDRIESIVIEDGVTSIGDYAFVQFTNLKSISIPASVETIGFLPFDGCVGLERFDVAENSAVYSSVDGVLFSKDKTTLKLYPRNKADAEYAVPDGVKTIATFAFYECQKLQKLSLPASVETIGVSGIDICWSLTEINVAEDNANYCSVDGVLFSKDRSTLISYPRGNTAEQYVIPDGTKTVENRSFRCSKYLRSVVIPASVESIGQITFYDCALTDVYFTGTQEQWDSMLSQNEFSSGVDGATVHCDYVPPHTHSYTATVTAPTCTEGGYTTYTCACGDSYVDDYTGALGHSYKKGTCTRCGEKDPNYVAAPVIKITTSAGKPKISWSKVDGAAKYKVYRSTNGKTYKLYTTVTAASYTDKDAKIGTTYYYKVKAVNSNGAESVYSNAKSIKCVPAAPTVTISRSGGKAKLSWKKVSGAKKYWIYRSTDGKTYKQYTSTTKLSYTDSKSKSGTKYYYKVKAIAVVNNTNVGSAYSTAKSITTTLAKPTVKITTSNGKPKLTWSKVTGADKYYIYRSTDGKTFKYYTSTTKLSYTNTGAKKNTKYYYKVKAICSSSTAANSAYSTVVSIKATK